MERHIGVRPADRQALPTDRRALADAAVGGAHLYSHGLHSYIVLAYIVMADAAVGGTHLHSHGLYSNGLFSHGLYIYHLGCRWRHSPPATWLGAPTRRQQ